MFPGLSERERLAVEMRRQELLAEAMRGQRLPSPAGHRSHDAVSEWRRSLGAALVRLGGWVQGAKRSAAAPLPAADPVGAAR